MNRRTSLASATHLWDRAKFMARSHRNQTLATMRARLAKEVGRTAKQAPFTVALTYPSPYRTEMSSLGFLQVYRRLLDEPGMAGEPGTKIGDAVRLAVSKMPDSQNPKAIVLLTDGEDHKSGPESAAQEAAVVSAASRGVAARAAICEPSEPGVANNRSRRPTASRLTAPAILSEMSIDQVSATAAASVVRRSRSASSASSRTRRART